MNRLLSRLGILSLTPLASLLAAAPAAPQEVAAIVSSITREDSIRLHRSARSRQAAFERVRRHSLPWAWGGGRGECDERIGRFCLTYSDEDAPEWEPPEESETIVEARLRLLAELSDAALAIPGDAWVVAQLVRYLVEAERFGAARAAAELCRAERWWCEALRGYAAHNQGEAGAADSAFTQMLTLMPDEKRRRWTDLSTILETRTLRAYRRMEEDERAAFETRFWTLADPLLQTPGNDLRSEHFARNLLVELQDRSETTENISWGDDLEEILLRFGSPSGWERIRRPFQLHSTEISLLTHFPESDLDLVPPPELLVGEFDPTAGIWGDENRRPRASYPLPRGGERLRWLKSIQHQTAVFRGEDSALVVVAYHLPADSFPEESRIDAALSVRPQVEGEPLVVVRPDAGNQAVMSLATPLRPALVSVEALAAEQRRAARARFGLTIEPLVPGRLAASDLLVLNAEADSVAESRDEAIRLARGSVEVRVGERIGVYWELYSPGVPWPAQVEMSLRLLDGDAGWLRRMAERAGIVDRIEPVRLVWRDGADTPGTLHRSLVLRVPDDTPPGRYTLELTVSAPGREPVVSRRTLEVIG